MTHIVIIDDSETNLDVLAQLFSLMDITYTAIQDPTLVEQVLDELEQADAVFLDLEMPKIDGYEMLHILREELGITAPIIAHSVYSNELDTARELGFDGFIGKPLELEHFSQQLQRIFEGEQVWET